MYSEAFCYSIGSLSWAPYGSGLNAIFALIKGHFIRAAIWGSLGFGMLAWWKGTDVIPDPWDFDKWLKGSAWVVGFGAIATFVRYCRKRKAMQAITTMPAWTPPKTPANDNQLVMFSLHERVRVSGC